MLVIVVGAGASHDCVSDGVNRQHYGPSSNYQPPIVTGLFNTGNSKISDVLSEYAAANRASADIQAAISSNDNSFTLEQYIREKLKNSRIAAKRLSYIEMPLYLQHLLFEFGQKYTQHPDAYQRLANKVFDFEKPLVISLNYDTIFDKQLLDHRSLQTLDDYLSDDDVSLIKLHGSVNWGRIVNDENGVPLGQVDAFDNYKSTIRGLADRLAGQLGDIELRPISNTLKDIRVDDDDEFIYYPALSVPIGEEDEIVCPTSHDQKLASSLEAASMIDLLFIGYSGNDKEVMNRLLPHVEKIESVKIITKQDSYAANGHPILRKLSPQWQSKWGGQGSIVKVHGFNHWTLDDDFNSYFNSVS